MYESNYNNRVTPFVAGGYVTGSETETEGSRRPLAVFSMKAPSPSIRTSGTGIDSLLGSAAELPFEGGASLSASTANTQNPNSEASSLGFALSAGLLLKEVSLNVASPENQANVSIVDTDETTQLVQPQNELVPAFVSSDFRDCSDDSLDDSLHPCVWLGSLCPTISLLPWLIRNIASQ